MQTLTHGNALQAFKDECDPALLSHDYTVAVMLGLDTQIPAFDIKPR